VHFFMSHLASWLRTRRFSEPTFRPSGAPNHWKNTVNRDFPIFSRIYLFFLLILSLLTLLTSAFQLSILSEVSLLNFLRPSIFINDVQQKSKMMNNFIHQTEYAMESTGKFTVESLVFKSTSTAMSCRYSLQPFNHGNAGLVSPI